ncbi:hypothetical protein F0562_017645 [Nyssa sinensis]|uniref:Uncharacterized protein n=1 Tax=Nyssa sinensis TaxID=561372 RepID=A0A5J4ZH42_9ASTE|nr:hypothetical protein F0562_017645 [Nyssa sinensis]
MHSGSDRGSCKCFVNSSATTRAISVSGTAIGVVVTSRANATGTTIVATTANGGNFKVNATRLASETGMHGHFTAIGYASTGFDEYESNDDSVYNLSDFDED